MVEKADKVKRLMENPLFKEIIAEGYLVQEAARLARMMNDPTIDAETRVFVERDLMGPSAVARYLSFMVTMGERAAQDIREANQELEEIRAEEDDPDVTPVVVT